MMNMLYVVPGDTETKWFIEIRRSDDVLIRVLDDETIIALIDQISEIAEKQKTEEETLAELAYQMAEKTATDEEILEVKKLIPLWDKHNDGNMYKKGVVRAFWEDEDLLYFRCVQSHYPQEGWEPNEQPALWALIGGDEAAGLDIINWFNPTSIHNYDLGQLMRFVDDSIWESLVANNVWAPFIPTTGNYDITVGPYPNGWLRREDLEGGS